MKRGEGMLKALREAGPSGLVKVPYSTGRAIKSRGYGDEIGQRTGGWDSIPTMTIQLNEEGLKFAHDLREREVYDATRKSVEAELDEILKHVNPFDAATEACRLVERLEQGGQSSASARAYRDVLQAHCREEVGM